MEKIKVLYIFKRPVLKDTEKARRGNFPKDFFYGAINSNKNIEIKVFDDFFYNPLLQKIQSGLYIFLIRLFRIGFSIILVLTQLKYVKRYNLVFATVDTIGLPLLMLKALGIISKPLIVNTGGLYDSLIEVNSTIYRKIVSLLFQQVNAVISGASYLECKKLSKLLSVPIDKFTFVPFGIDTGYFKPGKNTNSGKFILVIGADLKRDWSLVKVIAEKYPSLNFTIVTFPDLIKINLPHNCRVLYNQPIKKVRQLIRDSKFLFIPSFQNYHFAGQSTAFRTMSCAKTVIFTKSYGVEEYKIRNYKEAILIRPSNFTDVVRAFDWIDKNESKLKHVGTKAREYIIKNCNYKTYEKQIADIILKSI